MEESRDRGQGVASVRHDVNPPGVPVPCGCRPKPGAEVARASEGLAVVGRCAMAACVWFDAISAATAFRCSSTSSTLVRGTWPLRPDMAPRRKTLVSGRPASANFKSSQVIALRSRARGRRRRRPMAVSIGRSQWVSDSKATHCAAPGCGVAFDMFRRKHHCRRCGLVFCGPHSAHRMRLARAPAPDESGGNAAEYRELVRVCEACFAAGTAELTREAPAERPADRGVLVLAEAREVTSRERTKLFALKRARHNERMASQVAPVAQAWAEVRRSRDGRASSVPWIDDNCAVACKVCAKGFSPIVRRHHCRLCGAVVCAECRPAYRSRMPSLQPAPLHGDAPADGGGAGVVESSVLACTPCAALLARSERRLAFAAARAHASASPLAAQYAALSAAQARPPAPPPAQPTLPATPPSGPRSHLAPAAQASTRALIRTFDGYVSTFGRPGATATLAHAASTQQQLEAALTDLILQLKKFAATPASSVPGGGETAELAHASARRGAASFLKEVRPRCDAACRAILVRAARRPDQGRCHRLGSRMDRSSVSSSTRLSRNEPPARPLRRRAPRRRLDRRSRSSPRLPPLLRPGCICLQPAVH